MNWWWWTWEGEEERVLQEIGSLFFLFPPLPRLPLCPKFVQGLLVLEIDSRRRWEKVLPSQFGGLFLFCCM